MSWLYAQLGSLVSSACEPDKGKIYNTKVYKHLRIESWKN